MLKKLSLCLLFFASSCTNVPDDLTTTLAVDPFIEKFDFAATDKTNYSQCWNYESYMTANSNIKSSDGNTLFFAQAHKFKNQLKIILTGCANNGHDYVTVSIVDTSFLVVHTQGSGRDETIFTPIHQELTINKYPIEYGDTILANLNYKGIALREKWKLNADFRGSLSVVVTGDTAMTYGSVSDGLPEADYVEKITMVGIEDISKMGEFKNLKQLDITDKTYSGEFPSEILSLKHLEKLSLACNVSELPEQIDNLENLKTLNLWGNHTLKKLPKNLASCKRLKAINLRQNEGVTLNSFDGFDSLEYLNLSEINLAQLPDGTTALKALKMLDLSGNLRLDFSKTFTGLSRIKSLEQLELRYCNIKMLPNSFFALKNLKKINLCGNPLKTAELQRLRCEMPNTEIEFYGENE